MASYGVFLALCGFEYHGPKGHLGFAPRLAPDDFRAAFTAAEGWGTISQKRDGRRRQARPAAIAKSLGQAAASSLAFELPEKAQLDPRDRDVVLGGTVNPPTRRGWPPRDNHPRPAHHDQAGESVEVKLEFGAA